MAAFTSDAPQRLLTHPLFRSPMIRSAFDRAISAKMVRAEQQVAEHVAETERAQKPRQQFDLDAAIVGPKGIYAWPY
ncbi:MAG: hypothetical protein KI785_14780 [Devosiaceae bacterium]|nr:hypothetical protein [Devosiaceae bacterium MH13]